jgi:hypothetical protein
MVILFHHFPLGALDAGLLLDQSVTVKGTEAGEGEYTGALIPYLSGLLGDAGEFILSVSMSYRNDAWIFVPELLRTEITLRFGMGEFTFGRIPYRDPLGIIAEGFFDGTQASLNTTAGTFSVGGWYTGGIYKKRASITMTDEEMRDYDDFYYTYFAPSRVFSALSWEHPSLGGLVDIKLSGMGQVDLSGAGLNSQYFSTKIAVPFSYFVFDVGGCFGMVEHLNEFKMSMAAEMGLTLMLPTRLENHISLRGRFSSGVIEGSSIGAFLPITTIPQGDLLEAKLSGLSLLSLRYLSRQHRILSTEITASYFIRSDLETYTDYPVIGAGSGGYFLGPEFFSRFFCNLTSEIRLGLGAGVFLPMLGNAAPEAGLHWRVEANMLFSFF